MIKIAVMEGDGIGPEIIGGAISILESLIEAEFLYVKAGKRYFHETGLPMEENGIQKIKEADALLKGPVATPIRGKTYPSVNLRIRREFNLYANVRPFRSYKGISLREIDTVIVRENTEGLYSGIEEVKGGGEKAVASRVITRDKSERISEYAFKLAEREGRNRVTAIHKRNVLKVSDGLFLESFYRVAEGHPNIVADDAIVDAAAYKLVKVDKAFDVMVTPNLYGDILSDVAAGVVGSLGLCGSAQIGDDFAAFEPIHGTAEDIAGKGIANPLGAVIASSLMLIWLGERDPLLREKGISLRKAVDDLVDRRLALTPDLGGSSTTAEVINTLLKLVS